MEIIRDKETLRERISELKKRKGDIGFVPTMGYLHEGHLNLVSIATKMTANTIVSIYINPAQFSPKEDLAQYPRDLDRDLSLLSQYNPELIFCPSDELMYGKNHLTWIQVDSLSDKLCGQIRDGHFRGVTTIVAKLINLVTPKYMFMGEKDYQQIVVLEKMITDLDMPVEIIRCPTVREVDGLAMSSRNAYLSEEERLRASCLYKSLLLAKSLATSGNEKSDRIISEMKRLIQKHDGVVDYVEIIDSRTLESVSTANKGCRVALAVRIGKTRLIDNIEL